ncbi:uncharacterized protein [Montipora capricornis]|uniref:uncharacterized protein isoform X3 n=1 Tax=Montipora capricornis TaxID=246305 RepID=UPI0035F1D703
MGNGFLLLVMIIWMPMQPSSVLSSQSTRRFVSLVFFYQQGNESALLSTYIQTGTYPEVKQKLIWRGKQGEKERTWVKVQIALPADLDEYRVLLHGKVNKSLYNHSANYLSIDNLELLGCSKRDHRISNSVFSGHFQEAITYISKTGQSRQTSIAIERCKIVNSDVAIFIDIRDSDFTLAHNLISENYELAFAATLRVSQGTVSSKGLIYRNTISGNNKGIMVKQEERSKDDPVFLYILENSFENNNYFYYHWSQFQGGVLKLLNIPCWIKNNVFFNNSGFIVIESTFQGPISKGQQCEMNTFYLNRGPGKSSGTCAVLSDGQMSYHRNNFKNPSFLYEFCATNATDKTHAEMNWWGVDQESEVALRIHDREDFHHLSTVIHKPFQKLPPKGILSRGCPPGWMNQDSICAVLRGGSETFKEARDYCEYYGGHIASTTDPADLKIVYARMEPSSIYGSPAVPIWVTNGEASQGDVGNREQQCTVITQNGTQKIVLCNGLHPFICIRKAVNRCPNSCFHNGDCVGATCFCRRGWTGEDCSQFHCRDVHNCSRRGECLGPNLCKCQRGYAGRGCTYSYCTKFHRCSTCSRGDSVCGWCDSLKKCMPGTPKGPYSYNCPDWFYYHCYTVGSSSRCSHTIQRVDCANRQCNLAQDTSDKETCQKCHDLENCFNHVEQRKCRAWNETQCPLGLLKVDYKDTKRIENTMIRSNVKVINPDIATIYRCPTSPDMDDRMSVFVAPRSLGIKIGDVLSSPQAGGLMHKVNETTNTGPYTMILGLEAGIEELIQYADFTQNVSAVEITDQATVDEEPYLNDLYGLIEGNVTLNSSDLHILQSDTPVFKCVGHLYKVGDELVPTQFLVISKDHAFVAKPEDVIISTHSHGFIEKVTKVSHVSDLMFLETELERCTENSTWVQRFKSHLSGDFRNDNVTCTGGDNSLSLITFEPDNEKHKNVSVNDVIVGRNSNPILAKVIEMKANGNYVLIEVLPVTFIANGTAFTSVRFDQLRKQHRRQKRDIEHMKNEFHQTYTLPRWKIPLFGGSYTTVQVTIKVNADFTLSFGIQTRRDKNGDLVSRDPLFGMEIGGQIIFEADMETVIKKSVDFFKRTHPLLHSPVQLGPVFWIPIGNGKVSIQSTLTVSGKTRLGGHCTFSGGCQKIQPRFDVDSNFNMGTVEAQTGCSIEVQVSPNLSLKMPTKPKWLRKAIKKVKQLWKKVFFGFKSKTKQKKSDWSLIQLSIETPFGMRAKLTLCSSYCAGKDELLFHAGFSEVVGKLLVGFTSKKHEIVAARWPLNWDITKRVCLDPSCKKSKPGCSCPTTPSPTTPALTTPSTTQPPTTPPPCDCTKEEEAIIGPDESCRCLPKCKDGDRHVLVNKRYECPEYPLCGKYPNCVLGRKGLFCSQPDVPGCPYGCSGNGVIVPLSDCTARCRCSTRWTGTCCQRRLPWRNWGDPHLETLDGIEFDYFGIGEFWGCKSIFNDFGIQFRYFAYQRASLTGGVAVKLGQSVLTIMSLKSINPQEYPKLRIDGELVNISAHTGQKMRLDNGSVIMEMQKAFSNSSEEAAVMLVSLQFESGLTLTTDVRYSHMMNRQFLNVFFTPTLAFKGYTEGLCGVMDDDQSNDLMGPNKKLYDDPIKFADSWRISTSHSNSSLRGTWSWNASNFHRDDVMDFSYTNPDFVPMYSLEGIDSFIIAKAQAACSSLGLSNSMLKSCVYDVSVTNDTSLTAQETFQEDCPGQCSGKGRCVNSTCQCMTGWSGESCQMGDCSNCSTEHGTCIKGFCECDDGWEGDTCDTKAICHSLNNCTSPKNGVCRRTDQCRCFDGYIGIDCSMVPTCYNVSNCSARGICIDYDVCKCQKDWTGENCTQFSCASLDHCSGQGRCIALYECACYPGWTGDSCALPDCAGVNRCSGNGECVSSNTCQCYPGFQGVNCSDIADCSTLGNCNGNGVCMQDSAGNLTCRCFAGFSGLNCSTPLCLSVNNCSGHGICVEADFCTCDEGYTGIDCANVSCEAINYCSGHGVCVAFDTCTCDSTWHGASCSVANCSGVNECSGKGDCILPNICECFPGYDGVACNMTASPNLHAPIFSTPFYNLTLSENVPINTHILKVNASDADTGRNAQLFFLLDNSDGVNSAFTIDSSSGKIFTLMNFDYEGSSPKFLKLKIMVLDDGVPRKSGFAFVYITIRDENDNCPVFNSTKAKSFNISQNAPPGTLLTTVSADDIDSGLNGEVRYSVSYASINERAFAVEKKSGEVTIINGLTERSYRFVVTARDLGVPSCSRQIELTVDVFQEPQTITVTSGITTEESRTSDPVASTTNPSSDVASPTNSSSDVPMSLQPQTSKWYTKPPVIIGMSLGFVFLVVLLVILFIAKKKRQTHPKPNDKTQESRDNEALEMDTVLQ